MKSIVILGASSVGKSTLLRSLAGVKPMKYGVKKAMSNPINIGPLLYIPEITGNVVNDIGVEVFREFVKANTVITDVSHRFRMGLKYVVDPEIIILDVDDETVEYNLRSRKGKTAGVRSFEFKLADCLKCRDVLRATDYPKMDYNQLEYYLKSKLEL